MTAKLRLQTPNLFALGIAALCLSACVSSRPRDANCSVGNVASDGPTASQAIGAGFVEDWAKRKGKVDVLLLSGGGAWGAYGAGFLAGWSKRADALQRPSFDIVTGVSTGAVIAPFALLGSSYDDVLLKGYRGVSAGDLWDRRSLLTIPFWSSLEVPDKLERRLGESLDDAAIAQLSTLSSQDRTVWVGSVNFDTGEFAEFNLSQLAAQLPKDGARKAIVEHIMAASAVPAALPPRFLSGCMYMDGGVLENLFMGHIGMGLENAIKKLPDVQPDVRVFAIVNGPVNVPKAVVSSDMKDIAMRAIDLQGYAVQSSSLRKVSDFAKSHGFKFYWTSADGITGNGPDQCDPPSDVSKTFEKNFTSCLFDKAKKRASDDSQPWHTALPN